MAFVFKFYYCLLLAVNTYWFIADKETFRRGLADGDTAEVDDEATITVEGRLQGGGY